MPVEPVSGKSHELIGIARTCHLVAHHPDQGAALVFAHPREFEHVAGHALVLHECGFARAQRLERGQLRAGNAELRNQVPPQRCTHHAFGVEQSATESQKPDV